MKVITLSFCFVLGEGLPIIPLAAVFLDVTQRSTHRHNCASIALKGMPVSSFNKKFESKRYFSFISRYFLQHFAQGFLNLE